MLKNITVEIAFDDGPAIETPTWTDVSAYVSMTAGISFSRGRGQMATTPEPGRLSLTLNNDDGRFTWGLVGGTYDLGRGDKPPLRHPIRLTVGAHTVWTGYVDEWSQEWEAGWRPRVRVTASDRLAKLALLKLDDGAIRSEILYDSPIAYYPLDEPAGVTSGGTRAGPTRTLRLQSVGAGAGSVDFGAGAMPDGVGTAVAFTPTTATNGQCLYGSGDFVSAGSSGATLEAWVRAAPAGSDTGIAAFYGTVGAGTMILYLTSAGKVKLRSVIWVGSTSVWVETVGSISLAGSSAWSHVAATVGEDALRVYVDGALDSDYYFAAAPGDGLGVVAVSAGGAISSATVDPLYNVPGNVINGQVAHVAVTPSALSATRIAEHYNAGKGAGSFYGESASDRFERLCRLSYLPAAQYATDATATTLVGAQSLGGVGMLDAIRQVTDSERGVVYLSGDGVLTYKSSATLATGAVSATVTNNDIEGDLSLIVNDQTVTNDVTVTREGGATQRRTDATSQATMGVTNAVTVDTILTTDAEASALADLLLSQGTAVQPRTGDLTVDLETRAATLSASSLLTLDTGKLIRVTGLPSTFPADSIDLEVRGVNGQIGRDKFALTFVVVPALTVEPWLLDDATYSVLSQTTRLAYP